MPEIGVKRNNNVKKSRQRVRTSGKKDERDWEEGPKAVLQKPAVMTLPSQGLNASLPVRTCHSTSELKRTLANVLQALLLDVGWDTAFS